MMQLSIRMRLTLSYCLILTLSLGTLGAGLFLVMRRSVYSTIDDDLNGRLQGVQRLMERVIPHLAGEDLQDEFREHSGLKPGGDMLKVWDGHGNVIFQSPSIRNYSIPAPELSAHQSISDLTVSDRPLRILTSTLRVEAQEYAVLLATPIAQSQQAVTQFGWLLLWSIPAVLVLAASGGYLMSRRALAPVDRITNTARSISAQNLSQRLVELKTGDELERLSTTLNEMMSRLQSSFQKITQFTADASHELRTPIALVRTTAEIALRRRRDEEEYREALREILSEAERTSSLIENLLLLARADSGAESLQRTRTNLTALVRETVEQGKRLASAKQVHLSEDIPDVEIDVDANADAVRRLLLILIDNAVKFTPPDGNVIVRVRLDQAMTTIFIEDSGIGITPDDLPHIFERFYRADRARTRDIGGTGLGLAIAKWIADVHHATIEAQSVLERGSLFRISFPVASESVSNSQTVFKN